MGSNVLLHSHRDTSSIFSPWHHHNSYQGEQQAVLVGEAYQGVFHYCVSRSHSCFCILFHYWLSAARRTRYADFGIHASALNLLNLVTHNNRFFYGSVPDARAQSGGAASCCL